MRPFYIIIAAAITVIVLLLCGISKNARRALKYMGI